MREETPIVVACAAIALLVVESMAIDASGQLGSFLFGEHRFGTQCLATHCVVPDGVGPSLHVFFQVWAHLGDPRLAWRPGARALLPGPVGMWVAIVVVHTVLACLAIVVFRLVRLIGGRTARPGARPHRAHKSHVERAMGRRSFDRHTDALYGKGAARQHQPLSLGRDVGTSAQLFAKTEDYVLGVGVPRVGKGEGFVIPAVLRHRGPAVVTATRHDTYMDTGAVRARLGPVHVFDPQGLVPEARKLHWNPVSGCESPQKAILRARGFAGFAGVGPAVDGGGAYWEQVAASIIRSYLHAAALEGLGVEQLLDWSRRPGAREPVRILSRHPSAAGEWAEDLAASTEVEPRHRDSIWATVRRAFDCFADPAVLAATRVDSDTFDPAQFLSMHGTIYLMGSPGAQYSVAPIVAALIEDIVDQARHEAAASLTRRLESGLLLMLDECANIAPLGDLPKLVAELGGLGIMTAVILQSVASARNIWGEAGERALRDLANVTLVWGGQKDVAFLTEISKLAGEDDEMIETVTHNEAGRSSSWSPRRMPVLPVETIANLDRFYAVVVSQHLRPRIALLPTWREDRALCGLVNASHATSAPASADVCADVSGVMRGVGGTGD